MLESDEQISKTLELAGEPVELPGGTTRAIPGHLVYNIPSFDSPYDIEKQEFDFQISYKDFLNLDVAKGDTLTYTLQTIEYSFKVDGYLNDLVGWVQLKCSLQSVIA